MHEILANFFNNLLPSSAVSFIIPFIEGPNFISKKLNKALIYSFR